MTAPSESYASPADLVYRRDRVRACWLARAESDARCGPQATLLLHFDPLSSKRLGLAEHSMPSMYTGVVQTARSWVAPGAVEGAAAKWRTGRSAHSFVSVACFSDTVTSRCAQRRQLTSTRRYDSQTCPGRLRRVGLRVPCWRPSQHRDASESSIATIGRATTPKAQTPFNKHV